MKSSLDKKLEITVTPQDGHLEKVLMSKNGDNYVAKRDNEPQVYQVESKSVEDLLHTAEQMKSETPKPTSETQKH